MNHAFINSQMMELLCVRYKCLSDRGQRYKEELVMKMLLVNFDIAPKNCCEF